MNEFTINVTWLDLAWFFLMIISSWVIFYLEGKTREHRRWLVWLDKDIKERQRRIIDMLDVLDGNNKNDDHD